MELLTHAVARLVAKLAEQREENRNRRAQGTWEEDKSAPDQPTNLLMADENEKAVSFSSVRDTATALPLATVASSAPPIAGKRRSSVKWKSPRPMRI